MHDNSNNFFWSRFWGMVFLGIGILLLLQTLEVIAWEVWEFVGPLLLIVWGIAVISKPGSFVWCCCIPFWVQEQKD